MPDDAASHWARVDQIFSAVLAEEPTQRAELLARASGGDAALIREVGALLDSLEQAEVAIGDAADALLQLSGPLVAAPDAALEPGTRIGAYEVLRLLGRGGMGNVYVGVRADREVAREVAIKVVRGGARPETLASRFLRERRILASLEHPRIARLYDSGVMPDGAPFLVMELVQGERIDRHVAAHDQSVDGVLRLFDEVCEGVSFAHQRLVVHRDLKPANILVSASGHATLLDFGIAGLLADGEVVLGAEPATRPGQMVLTPEYASPEQAHGEPADVAMDVYALGVLLHELLTGARPPWQRMVMTRASEASIAQAMVPPSAQVTDAARARALRGDLDQVILKALAPARADRYPSVQALRDELRRVREGYPILARRASVAKRVGRFVRRNPVLSGIGGALAITVLAFTVTTWWQSQRVLAERDRANIERDRARTTAQLLVGLFERADPFAPGGGDTVRLAQVLDEGVARVERDLAGQPAVRAELLHVLGRAYSGLGRYAEAQRLLDTARVLRETDPSASQEEVAATLTALGNLARLRERFAAADSLHDRALVLREANANVRTATVPARAMVRGVDSAYAAAAARLAASLVNVGSGHMERARFDSARIYLDSGLAMLRALPVADTGKLADALNNRAMLANRMGDPLGALQFSEESHELNRARLGADHPRVAAEAANLGFLLDRAGRSAEAVPRLREALRVLRLTLPEEHMGVRTAMLNLGGAVGRAGDLNEAERLITRVVTLERALGPDGRMQLTFSLDNLAGVFDKLGRTGEAEAAYREAHAIRESVTGDKDPGASILLSKVADVTCRTGGAPSVSLEQFERALPILDRFLPIGHGLRLSSRAQYGSCLVRAARPADGARELLAAFDGARGANPTTHGIARNAGRELLLLLDADSDAAQRAVIQAHLDALGATPRPQ